MFHCDLIDSDISGSDCIIVCDVADDMLKETAIDSKFKVKEDFKEICKNCKFHNYEEE